MRRLLELYRAWRRTWGRVEAVALVGLLFLAGCSNTVALAARIPPAAACHKKASEFIQMAKTCAEAQTLASADESCQQAYPGGLDFHCKEMP